MSTLEDPLVRAFEASTVDGARFRHREHLYVAFCLLRALPFEEAAARYVGALRRLAAALGVPQKFHATMTWAYLTLLDEAMHRPGLEAAGFDEVLAGTPALLDDGAALLRRHYGPGELDDPEARRRFVLPRGAPGV